MKEHGELYLEDFYGPDLEWHTLLLFWNLVTGLHGTVKDAEECSPDVGLGKNWTVSLLLSTSSL